MTKSIHQLFWSGAEKPAVPLKPAFRASVLLVAMGVCLLGCNQSGQETTSDANAAATDSASASAESANGSSAALVPTGPKPAWAPTITPPMQTVIEQLASYKTPPLPTLSAPEARKAPSPTDAVMALMQKHNIPMPPAGVDTAGRDIAVKGGKIHLRVYTPKSGQAPFPVIVYYHGGGWVIADLDTYHPSAQALSEQTGSVLVSVAYRQAPEHKFPTAHNDSYAAYEWTLKNAASLKGDPKRVAVVGESAGGNLAADVSMMARKKGVMVPLHQVLVYPIASSDTTSPSYGQYAAAKPLDKPLMQWFFKQYLRSPADGKDPMINLVKAPLKGMPPTTIIGAEIDPLLSEGQQLAEGLKAAGVPVTYRKFDGVTHEFFGMATVLEQAKEAQALAAAELKKAFSAGASGQAGEPDAKP